MVSLKFFRPHTGRLLVVQKKLLCAYHDSCSWLSHVMMIRYEDAVDELRKTSIGSQQRAEGFSHLDELTLTLKNDGGTCYKEKVCRHRRQRLSGPMHSIFSFFFCAAT